MYNIVTGKQVQLNGIEKYFQRPRALENISFLEFYSLFDIAVVKEIDASSVPPDFYDFDLESIPNPNRFKNKNHQEYIPNTFMMGFCLNDYCHPEYRLLKVVKRKVPAIVITNKYGLSVSQDDFYFHWLLIHGHWRSDSEILVNQSNYREASIYHGLSEPSDNSNETVFQKDFLEKVIVDPRYSILDIVRICYNLYNQDVFFDPICILNRSSIANDRKELIIKTYNRYVEDLHSLDQDINSYSSNLSDEALLLIHAKFSDDERKYYQLNQGALENSLNKEQKQIYDEAINSLKENNGVNSYHYIAGKAGAGKSFLIKSIISWCIANNKTYIFTASTGIAASIINGTTFHSAFQVFEDGTNIYSSLRVSSMRGQAINRVNLIIVDEITMLKKKTLEVASDALNRMRRTQICNDNSVDLPFGGKTVLFLGDPAQVPAVTESKSDFDEARQQFFNSLIFSNHFKKHKLFESMRTLPGEQQLIQILDEVKNGTLTNHTNTILKRLFRPNLNVREIDNFLGNGDPGSLVIFYKNNEVNEYNNDVLSIRQKKYKLKEYIAEALFFEDSPPTFLSNGFHFDHSGNCQFILDHSDLK